MRNIASKALAQVWSDIHEGMEFKTPDDRAGKLFSVQSVDEDSILVLTEKGMTEVRLGRAAFLFHTDSSTEIRWTTPKPDTASLSIA